LSISWENTANTTTKKAVDSEDIDKLVAESEMLKFVLFLVCRNGIKEEK
jgi:hypothetical protein